MIIYLLGHKDYIRVLLALEEKPMRFNSIQKALKLNPTQLDRALKFLREGLWVVPHVAPSKGRLLVEYRLGKRGKAFLESFHAFRQGAERRMDALGASEVAELKSLYR